MSQAVIVSVARTPIGRAYKGAFNAIKSPTLLGHAIGHAVARAGAGPDEVDDVVVGTVLGAGTAGMNLARNAALAAGLGVAVSGQTLDRQCASGLMAVATAAKQIIVDGMRVVVAGGQENISAVQKGYFDWASAEADPAVQAKVPHAYMPMLQTAEFVARKYGIGREAQDLYALQSQQRTAAAQQAGRFDAEIVPLPSRMAVVDKETQAVSHRDVTLAQDEGNRPETTLESLAALKPAFNPKGGTVTAGTSSQITDGASCMIVMSAQRAQDLGIQPMAVIRSMALAGVDPAIMGYGPVPATQKALKRAGLTMDDINYVELNEAFAAQALPVLKDLKLLDKMEQKVNLHGGAIALGHPFGCSGARISGTLLNVMKQKGGTLGVATMCIGLGQGITTVFERV